MDISTNGTIKERQDFDVANKNGQLVIYKSHRDEFGDTIWTEVRVTKEELQEIVEEMQKFL